MLPDLAGEVFNRWTVLKFVGVNAKGAGVRLWLCRCSCGTEKVMGIDSLRRGTSKSCGCLQEEHRRDPKGPREWMNLGHGMAARNSVVSRYKRQSRGHTWELSDEQMDALFQGNCFYCGIEPSLRAKIYKGRTGIFIYNGIDRVDNTKGYEPGNVVSCCRICNTAKNNMPYAEFLVWVKRVHTNLFPRPSRRRSNLNGAQQPLSLIYDSRPKWIPRRRESRKKPI